MTREQLIEMLWEEYKSSEYVDVVDEPSFSDAINTALDAQARGSAEGIIGWAQTQSGETDREFLRKVFSAELNAILTADPEVTP